VKIYLNNTNYQEFDAWLCNKAKKYKFLVSYDELDLIDDLGELDQIPKKTYPLRIFLSKIYPDGRSYGQDGFFIIEKVGERLKVCPKAYSRGVENLKPILKEIADDWPETQEIIMRDVFKINLVLKRNNNPPGRPHWSEDVWAWNEIFTQNRQAKDVYSEWLIRADENIVREPIKDPDRQFNKIKKHDWLKAKRY
jgi:hypothetical protein